MLFARRFEERCYEAYVERNIGGFLHLYPGEEACAIGVLEAARVGQDYVITSYRDHVHAIKSGSDPRKVMAELFAKETGVSKGRGFSGMIRRHGFNAGPKSHGSKNIRQMGSTGMHTDPGRVFPGRPMPGHMGAVNRKARNLKVVSLDETENLLLVKGSVPGPRGGYVYVEESLG